MFAQRPSFRFLTVGALFSLVTLTFLLLNTRRSRDLTSQYILKTPRPVSHCPPSSSTQPLPNNTNINNQLEAWEFHVDRDGNDHGLSEEQCRIAFPKLFGEIEKSAALRSQDLISYEELRGREIEDGMVRCIIDRGEVCIDYSRYLEGSLAELQLANPKSEIVIYRRIRPSTRDSIPCPRNPKLPPPRSQSNSEPPPPPQYRIHLHIRGFRK
jgi:hypothetical protein